MPADKEPSRLARLEGHISIRLFFQLRGQLTWQAVRRQYHQRGYAPIPAWCRRPSFDAGQCQMVAGCEVDLKGLVLVAKDPRWLGNDIIV